MAERPYNAQNPNRGPQIIATRNVDERICPPPSDANPTDGQIHTRWVRNTPERVSTMQRKYGYEKATEADVGLDRGGYLKNDEIQKGDLVLMKAARDVIEDTEVKRRTDVANMDRQLSRADKAAGIEERSGHGTRRGRPSKTYNIPIELNK